MFLRPFVVMVRTNIMASHLKINSYKQMCTQIQYVEKVLPMLSIFAPISDNDHDCGLIHHYTAVCPPPVAPGSRKLSQWQFNRLKDVCEWFSGDIMILTHTPICLDSIPVSATHPSLPDLYVTLGAPSDFGGALEKVSELSAERTECNINCWCWDLSRWFGPESGSGKSPAGTFVKLTRFSS